MGPAARRVKRSGRRVTFYCVIGDSGFYCSRRLCSFLTLFLSFLLKTSCFPNSHLKDSKKIHGLLVPDFKATHRREREIVDDSPDNVLYQEHTFHCARWYKNDAYCLLMSEEFKINNKTCKKKKIGK